MSDVAVDLLAQCVGLSPHHFGRAFTQSMGVPRHRYPRLHELERARARLDTSQQSMPDIALGLGCDSSQALPRALRQELGVSPSE